VTSEQIIAAITGASDHTLGRLREVAAAESRDARGKA
jgi:hypothetical protein